MNNQWGWNRRRVEDLDDIHPFHGISRIARGPVSISLSLSSMEHLEREWTRKGEKGEREISSRYFLFLFYLHRNKFVHQASHASRFVARMIRIGHAACAITSLLTLVYSHRDTCCFIIRFRDEIYNEFSLVIVFFEACSLKRTGDRSSEIRQIFREFTRNDRSRSGGLLIDQTSVIIDEEEERVNGWRGGKQWERCCVREEQWRMKFAAHEHLALTKRCGRSDKREGGGELMPTRWIYLWSIRLEDRRVCLIEAPCIC